MENWRDYLAKHSSYILGGTHFINFAVQEPGGAMILEASYGQHVKSGRYVRSNQTRWITKKTSKVDW